MMDILDLQGEFIFQAMNMLNVKTKKQKQKKATLKYCFFIYNGKHVEVMVKSFQL